jgi:hypothetical protein
MKADQGTSIAAGISPACSPNVVTKPVPASRYQILPNPAPTVNVNAPTSGKPIGRLSNHGQRAYSWAGPTTRSIGESATLKTGASRVTGGYRSDGTAIEATSRPDREDEDTTMTDQIDAAAADEVVADDAVTRQVRASSAPVRQTTPFTPAEAAAITAELPVQRPPSTTVTRRPSEPVRARRQPAPALLQVLVWLLALLFLIVAVGAIVALVSPSEMSFLRNSGPAALHIVGASAG